uniref:Lipid-transfer protein n=1 Tax=Drosera adelae TaxID=173387 RepID=A0A1L7NZT9_9CARY|nr:lipid-transfer protein [Drosera adelae]
MAAGLKLATLAIWSCLVIVGVAPQASYAAFIGYDWGTTFFYCCKDYIQTGIDCALDYACCPVIAQFAGAVNKASTKDEISYSCLAMKSALYSMPYYNYTATATMVAKCGYTLPYNVAKTAPCY